MWLEVLFFLLLAGEATMPASDPAHKVYFGIKTGAFYGQESELSVLRKA
jgi:hypothetical protein